MRDRSAVRANKMLRRGVVAAEVSPSGHGNAYVTAPASAHHLPGAHPSKYPPITCQLVKVFLLIYCWPRYVYKTNLTPAISANTSRVGTLVQLSITPLRMLASCAQCHTRSSTQHLNALGNQSLYLDTCPESDNFSIDLHSKPTRDLPTGI